MSVSPSRRGSKGKKKRTPQPLETATKREEIRRKAFAGVNLKLMLQPKGFYFQQGQAPRLSQKPSLRTGEKGGYQNPPPRKRAGSSVQFAVSLCDQRQCAKKGVREKGG